MLRLTRRASVLLVGALVLAGCSAEDEPDLPEGVEDVTGAPGDDTAPNEAQDADDTPTDDLDPDEPAPDDEPDGDGEGAPSGDDADGLSADEVDEIVNGLLAVQSEVLREVVAADPGDGLDEEQSARLGTALSGPELLAIGTEYQGYATDGTARDVLLDPDELGDIAWRTERIVHVEDDACIVAIGHYDLREVVAAPYPEDQFAILSVATNGDDEDPWRLHDLNVLMSDGEPVPEEDWDRINYDDVLQTTCA